MSKKAVHNLDVDTVLAEYKQKIDADIESYSKELVAKAQNEFGDLPSEVLGAYVAILSRGGKRLRGTLTMVSYEMFGGTNEDVALQAARAIEMLHAYILILDDIQDRSELRRGGETSHIKLKIYHEDKKLNGHSLHFGESIAINGSLIGLHTALNVIAGLQVSADIKIAAIRNINQHFITTAHGQTLDIFNAAVAQTSEQDIQKMMEWKTAYYTFMNPMQLGAILAGAAQDNLAIIEQFSLHAGRAFQLADDIHGIYGTEEETGKREGEDLREGKFTLLLFKAIALATRNEAEFLKKMRGNQYITDEDLNRCRAIITSSGALLYAQTEVKKAVDSAILELEKIDPAISSNFLRDLLVSVCQT